MEQKTEDFKLCRSCKYFRREIYKIGGVLGVGKLLVGEREACRHPKAERMNVVNGEVYFALCQTMRKKDADCGKEGRLYVEARDH